MTIPQQPEYQSVPTTMLNKMALTSMILGIIAIPTACIGVGLIFGIVALILGIISLNQISKNPTSQSGKGYAITGMITGGCGAILIIPLLIAILLPSLGRARELANRTACAANLNGITKAMLVYANENSDTLPATWAAAAPATGVLGTTAADQATAQTNIHQAAPGNPAACLWILVLRNDISPKSLLCKSDPQADSSASPVQTPGGTGWLYTPYKITQLSYSIDFPWVATSSAGGSVGGWWQNETDSSLPIMADMVLGDGASVPRTGNIPAGKRINSANHNGDGQNIGYGDAHTEWSRSPMMADGDDIRYYASNANGAVDYGSTTTAYPINGNNAQPYNIIMTPHKSTAGTVN